MMRYTCTACRMGMHESCDGRRPPPPGHFGGSECDCDGNCAERDHDDFDPLIEEMVALMEDARRPMSKSGASSAE